MSSRQTLIGLIGRKGAGKDTAADVLLREGYANVKFAGPLKAMLRSLLAYQGVDEETIERMIEGDLKEAETPYLGGRSPRYAMQRLGTEWGRVQIADDFWVNIAIAKASDGPSVITDTRFPNEADAIEAAGGVVFGIVADWIKAVPDEHPSEGEIDAIIDRLPAGRKIINRKAVGDQIAKAIQEFRWRFLAMFDNLGGAVA